jgi:carboxylesterase
MIAADFDVEAPRLPGHGTSIDDMVPTRWSDWWAEVDGAYDRLADRVEEIVVVGQSMGATLGLSTALAHPDVRGVVCVNPLTRGRDAAELAMIDDLLEDGIGIVPGEGSDIADPASHDISYDSTPLAPVRSLLVDGVSSITDRFGELEMPLRLFTSRNDHVVDPADSEHLASAWGGSVEHTWLERSFHVATRDYDRRLVEDGTADFARRVVS